MSDTAISSIQVATVQAELPAPVIFGNWIMRTREFAIVRVRLANGVEGWSFTLTRDGAVAEQIRRTLAPAYEGTAIGDREQTYRVARGRSHASHSAGTGLRAMSLVDLAAWDAAAREAEQSIAAFLGGRLEPMPATAIIGYPPGKMGPAEVEEQVTSLRAQRWARFKAPVAATPELSAERLRAARRAAPDAWIGCDAAWIYDSVDAAADFVNGIADVRLGWFEDIFPPGDAAKVAELRRRTGTPIAMGDEQGGSYYPEALLDNDAVDVVRIDLTCMGGITGSRRIVDECLRRGVAFAPHMFAHVHSQVFSAWGFPDVPVEWGVPWTGVDPYADSLAAPTIREDGRMEPLVEGPGFGELVNLEWLATQQVDDPDRILSL